MVFKRVYYWVHHHINCVWDDITDITKIDVDIIRYCIVGYIWIHHQYGKIGQNPWKPLLFTSKIRWDLWIFMDVHPPENLLIYPSPASPQWLGMQKKRKRNTQEMFFPATHIRCPKPLSVDPWKTHQDSPCWGATQKLLPAGPEGMGPEFRPPARFHFSADAADAADARWNFWDLEGARIPIAKGGKGHCFFGFSLEDMEEPIEKGIETTSLQHTPCLKELPPTGPRFLASHRRIGSFLGGSQVGFPTLIELLPTNDLGLGYVS